MYKRFDFVFVVVAALAVIPLALWWAADARARRESQARQEEERRRRETEEDVARTRLEADLAAVRRPYTLAEIKAEQEARARGLDLVAASKVAQELNVRHEPELRRQLLEVYARHGFEPPPDLLVPPGPRPPAEPAPSLLPPRKSP